VRAPEEAALGDVPAAGVLVDQARPVARRRTLFWATTGSPSAPICSRSTRITCTCRTSSRTTGASTSNTRGAVRAALRHPRAASRCARGGASHAEPPRARAAYIAELIEAVPASIARRSPTAQGTLQIVERNKCRHRADPRASAAMLEAAARTASSSGATAERLPPASDVIATNLLAERVFVPNDVRYQIHEQAARRALRDRTRASRRHAALVAELAMSESSGPRADTAHSRPDRRVLHRRRATRDCRGSTACGTRGSWRATAQPRRRDDTGERDDQGHMQCSPRSPRSSTSGLYRPETIPAAHIIDFTSQD